MALEDYIRDQEKKSLGKTSQVKGSAQQDTDTDDDKKRGDNIRETGE